MLGFFKDKIDLSTSEQRAELQDSYGDNPQAKILVAKILAGRDCDEIPEAVGPFGTVKNPIPVNGPRGELMYLKRLCCPCGAGIMFHRLGSTKIGANPGTEALDLFECVCLNGKHWDVLALDMYHPRRSLKTPPGYTNAPWDKTFSPLPIAFGVLQKLGRFPQDLPAQIAEKYADTFGRKCREFLGDGSKFKPPADHSKRQEAYLAAIQGNSPMGVLQAVLDLGDHKSDRPMFF